MIRSRALSLEMHLRFPRQSYLLRQLVKEIDDSSRPEAYSASCLCALRCISDLSALEFRWWHLILCWLCFTLKSSSHFPLWRGTFPRTRSFRFFQLERYRAIPSSKRSIQQSTIYWWISCNFMACFRKSRPICGAPKTSSGKRADYLHFLSNGGWPGAIKKAVDGYLMVGYVKCSIFWCRTADVLQRNSSNKIWKFLSHVRRLWIIKKLIKWPCCQVRKQFRMILECSDCIQLDSGKKSDIGIIRCEYRSE